MAKVKVPKRVAGVKVPKKLRKQAKNALKLVDSPGARDLALAGLALAAESIVDRAQPKGAAKTAAKEVLEQARSGRKQFKEAVKRNLQGLDLGDVLLEAAAEAARRFLEGFEEVQRKADKGDAAGGAKGRTRGPTPRRRPNGRSAASAASD